MALRVDFHDIKRALDKGSITPIEALHNWTTWALKVRTLELKPYFEYVRETLPIVAWHKPDEELLVHGYLPVTWTCPMDFYQWADDFMGQVFSMGAHLRRFIAEEDPTHAAALLEQSLTAIEKVKATMAKAPELKATGRPRADEEKGTKQVPLSKGGNDRLAARLKRDHPAIAARVANGEFKSIRAAALEAGIVKPMRSVPVDTPDAAIRALSRVFSTSDLAKVLTPTKREAKAPEPRPPSPPPAIAPGQCHVGTEIVEMPWQKELRDLDGDVLRKEAHRRLESIAAMAERNCSDLAGYVETIREGDLWKKLADDWETFCLEYFGRPARFVDCLVAGVKALEVAP